MKLDLKWELSDRQIEAHNADDDFLLYGGAKGGGKTVWLCQFVVKECAQFRQNKGFFGRRRLTDFNLTTLDTFTRFIDPRIYRINKMEKKIYFPWCEGVVDYGGLDDPEIIEKFNSAEYGFFAVDQAEEIERDQFSMLRATLRYKNKKAESPKYKGRLTANPRQGWLKDDFILNPKPNFRFIQALPSDNPFLASGYVRTLKDAFQHRPELLAAYLYGSWDDLSGHDICIQSSWIERAKRRTVQGTVIKRIVVNDPARFADDENVIYVMEQTEDGARIADHEFLSNTSTMETAGRLAAKRRKFGASGIYVDAIGIGIGICDRLDELGEPVTKIVSSQSPTISIMTDRFLNLRAQMWLEAGRKFAENKCQIPHDDSILAGQLGTPRFDFKSGGKMYVESKEEIKKRLNRSPDRGDCYIMGLWALDHAGRLDEQESPEKFEDRQGQGTKVYSDSHDQNEFSGYGG